MNSFGPARTLQLCVRWLLVVLFAAGTARAQAPPASGAVAASSPAAAATVRARHDTASGLLLAERNGRERHAPGRIIVKYRDTVGAAVEASLAGKDTLHQAPDSDTAALDAIHRTLRIQAARPLLSLPAAAAAAATAAHGPDLRPGRLDAVRQRYPARNARAPRGAALPDLDGVLVLSVPATTDIPSAVAALRRSPLVEYAQPDFRYAASFAPDDPYYGASGSWGQPYRDLWGLQTVRAGEAWDISRGDGVVVAVVDTGVDYAHPDIAANVWVNPGEIPGNGVDDDANGFVDDTRGWDFAYADNDPTDDFGHGTHVAGIVAATGGNASGVVGIAYGAKVMPIKGLDAEGSGWTSDLAAGIVYAADNGADVINNSWGGGGPTPADPVLEDAIRLAHGLGAVVVFAAGNEAADLTGYNPQDMPEVIVVAASSERDTPAWFTNRGAALDLAAPGGGDDDSATNEGFRNILSLAAGVCNPGMCPTELTVAPGYVRQAGTSMAAPFVSGAAALLIAAHPERLNEQVRQALRRGSFDLGSPGFDATWGYGRLDAAAALAEDAPAALLTRPRAGEILADAGACEVRGVADGVPLASWTLEVGAGDAPSAWTTLASSDARVGWDGVLGAWDTGHAADGTHTLRLTARNGAGRLFEDRIPVTVENVRISYPAAGKEAIIRGGSLVQIEGTAAPLGFGRYAVSIASSHGSSVAGEAIRLPGGGLEPVRNGLLATWDTTGLPPDHYLVELAVTLAGGETRRLTRSVIVDPTLHPGWPLAIDENASEGRYTLTLADHLNSADLDGDGAAELVIGYGSQVDVFKGDASHLPGWPQSIDPAGNGGGTQWGAAIGDVDGDGKLEVVASSWDQDVGRLFVWRADGTALPGWPLILGASPLFLYLWDFERDGSSEIVAVDWDGNVNVLDARGRPLPGWPRVLPLWTWRAAIGDADGDRRPEIAVTGVVEDGSSRMYLLGSDGQTLPGWPVVIPTEQMGGTNPALGDLDNDGDLEIVLAASFSGEIHAYHHDGSVVTGWPAPVYARGANPPTIGDLDGDGKVEVIAGSFVDLGRPVAAVRAARGRVRAARLADPSRSARRGTPLPGRRAVQLEFLRLRRRGPGRHQRRRRSGGNPLQRHRVPGVRVARAGCSRARGRRVPEAHDVDWGRRQQHRGRRRLRRRWPPGTGVGRLRHAHLAVGPGRATHGSRRLADVRPDRRAQLQPAGRHGPPPGR